MQTDRHLGRFVAYALLVALVLPFLYLYLIEGMRFFAVPSQSMEPTLNVADYIITFPQPRYAPGEVIVLRDPDNPADYVVKRIVATEGQVVSAKGGALFVNGRYVSEPYLNEPMNYNLSEFIVPSGRIFVLGDNRNESRDSHNWIQDAEDPKKPGKPMAIGRDKIVGRVHSIYLPFDRIQRVRAYPLDRTRAG